MFVGLRDYPPTKITMAADGRIIRIRPAPVLLWKYYRQHRMPTAGAIEGYVIPKGVAEKPIAVFIDASEAGDSCHVPIPLIALACVLRINFEADVLLAPSCRFYSL